MTTPIDPNADYFGMTVMAYDYNWGPPEAWPTALGIDANIVRSWDVWSPGDGTISYLGWGNIETAPGVYNWTALNAWIAASQAHGAQMVYTFGNGPSFDGNNGTTPNMADFQAFVTAIVEHANGSIKYWEGMNEFSNNGMSAATVLQMQEIIYNTVHSLDPGALVLSPTVNSSGSNASYAQFLADGGGNYFDIAAFHGYNNDTGEGVGATATAFQTLLTQYGINKPIWDTEWGMEAPSVLTGTTNQEAFVSTGLILQAAAGVQTEIFYSYDLNSTSGLYNSSTGQLTPAGVAFETTQNWLLGATLGPVTNANGVFTAPITLANGAKDLLVWDANGSENFTAIPAGDGHYETTQGVTETVSSSSSGHHHSTGSTVIIGITPILFEH